MLIPLMSHPFWYATPENDWEASFHRYLPMWLTVRDLNVLQGYYKGYSFYSAKYIKAWITPVLLWTGFIFVMVFIMICINVVFRKRWVEQERLAYPMIQLPYEMIDRTSSFFRSKLMWIGFGIIVVLDTINGIHTIWPVVPGLSLKLVNINQYITAKPWSAIGDISIVFYPFLMGLAFFIPLDLSFSMWFFFLFWKAQRILWYVLGLSAGGGGFGPGYRVIIEQASGAYLAE